MHTLSCIVNLFFACLVIDILYINKERKNNVRYSDIVMLKLTILRIKCKIK